MTTDRDNRDNRDDRDRHLDLGRDLERENRLEFLAAKNAPT